MDLLSRLPAIHHSVLVKNLIYPGRNYQVKEADTDRTNPCHSTTARSLPASLPHGRHQRHGNQVHLQLSKFPNRLRSTRNKTYGTLSITELIRMYTLQKPLALLSLLVPLLFSRLRICPFSPCNRHKPPPSSCWQYTANPTRKPEDSFPQYKKCYHHALSAPVLLSSPSRYPCTLHS